MSQYVEDEDDETFSQNLVGGGGVKQTNRLLTPPPLPPNRKQRVQGADVIGELMMAFEAPAAAAFAAALNRVFASAEAQRAAGDPNWWRMAEAALAALGSNADVMVEYWQQGRESELDLASFLGSLLLDYCSQAEFPFLQARALWLASKVGLGPGGGGVSVVTGTTWLSCHLKLTLAHNAHFRLWT